MGAIIAAILRPVAIWLVQLGVTTAAVTLIERLTEALVNWTKSTSGADQADSEAYVTNMWVDALLYIGVGALVLKGKLPINVAKKIGLGNATPTKVKLSASGEAKTKAVSDVTAALKVAPLLKNIAWVGGIISGLVWLVNVPAQIIEPGIYKPKQTNDVYDTFLGIRPFPEGDGSDSPGRFTPAEFTDYARGLEAAGIKGIEYGFPKGTVLYSRSALAELVDFVTGQEEGKGNAATPAKVKPLIAKYLIGLGSTPVTTTTPAKTTTTVVQPPKVQVFTGVVSQGVLGNGTVFSPRSNDMIDDAQELMDSAGINLAGYLASLPSRIIYEVKIVSSITTKDGFTQRGTTTQVVSGYYANGSPKYKTVTNKFAVLNLYIQTDKGTRSKLATINVGPVNSVNFQPDSIDFASIASYLSSYVTTSKTSDITTIVSDTPVAVTQKEEPPAPLPQYNNSEKIPGDLGFAFYKRINPDPQPPTYTVVPDYKFWDPTFGRISEEEYRRATGDTKDYTNSGYQLVNGVFTQVNYITPTTTLGGGNTGSATTAPPAQRPGANANTLAEWYAANGQSLPAVSVRAVEYESFGLGSAALYIGTSEQNIRLLNKKKGF